MRRHRFGWCLSMACCMLAGCHVPGRPKPGDEVPRPEAEMRFEALYGQNCAGCHGADGNDGAATDLANPEYQALIDDATLRDVIANGEKGTLMPGFGRSGGGNLTDAQVDVLLRGMRSRWGRGNVLAGLNAPPYKAPPGGDVTHGQQVYAAGCARCHGAAGQQPGPAGSILDGSFLALVNAQTIRTTIIAGRPDIGQPDWRDDVPGRALTDGEIADVTAWLLAQRPPNPGQPYPDNNTTTEKPAEAQPTAPVKR